MSEALVGEFRTDLEWTSSTRNLRLYPAELLAPALVFVHERPHIRNRVVHLPKIEISGIPCSVRPEAEEVVLESDQWPSLRASGPRVEDAIADMRSLLHDVIEEYVLCAEDTLSDDAKDFRYYLMSTLV